MSLALHKSVTKEEEEEEEGPPRPCFGLGHGTLEKASQLTSPSECC